MLNVHLNFQKSVRLSSIIATANNIYKVRLIFWLLATQTDYQNGSSQETPTIKKISLQDKENKVKAKVDFKHKPILPSSFQNTNNF